MSLGGEDLVDPSRGARPWSAPPAAVWAAAFGTAYALAFEAAYQAADGATEVDRRFIASMSVDVARVRFIADAAAAEAAAA